MSDPYPSDAAGAPGGPGGSQRPPTEDELRAAYEAELKRITVADVLIQTTVSLVNLAGRKIGLAEGTQGERDLEQVREAIDAARALLPLVERHGDAKPIRDALSQLQMAYAREVASAGEPADAAEKPAQPDAGEQQAPGDAPGPAQSSGRLWVPGS